MDNNYIGKGDRLPYLKNKIIMKNKLEEEYENALELFGVGCGLWKSFHTNFSPSYFCKANRKSIIAEYLYWRTSQN